MEDENVVQPDATSKEGEALPEVKPPEGGEPQPQPLEEQIKQLTDQLAEQTNLSKREIQSFKDKALREIESAQARAGLAEDTLAGLEKDTDPEAAELHRLRASDKYHRNLGAAQAQRQQAEAFDKSFQENVTQFITQMGVDPNDKRIDWGIDAKDYLSKQQRILTSIGKIQQENQAETQKKLESDLGQRQKDFEGKIRKDLGLDTEETGVSPGVGGTDADFLDKFGKGELPYTKENVDRANKIMNK